MCGRRQTLREPGVSEHADEALGQPLRIAGLDQQSAGLVVDEVRDAADATRDARPASTESLHDHAAHAFRTGGQHEDRRLAERSSYLRLRQPLVPARLPGEIAEQLVDEVPKRPAADESQACFRHARGCETPRVREAVDVLVTLEHADEEPLRTV